MARRQRVGGFGGVAWGKRVPDLQQCLIYSLGTVDKNGKALAAGSVFAAIPGPMPCQACNHPMGIL